MAMTACVWGFAAWPSAAPGKTAADHATQATCVRPALAPVSRRSALGMEKSSYEKREMRENVKGTPCVLEAARWPAGWGRGVWRYREFVRSITKRRTDVMSVVPPTGARGSVEGRDVVSGRHGGGISDAGCGRPATLASTATPIRSMTLTDVAFTQHPSPRRPGPCRGGTTRWPCRPGRGAGAARSRACQPARWWASQHVRGARRTSLSGRG